MAKVEKSKKATTTKKAVTKKSATEKSTAKKSTKSAPAKALAGHGGRRQGAGRPKTSDRVPHLVRPEITRASAVWTTFKLNEKITNLRQKSILPALLAALTKVSGDSVRLIHFTMLSDTVHLIVEADDKRELAIAMQSFALSFAGRVNFLCERRGRFWDDRYSMVLLKNAAEMKSALNTVLFECKRGGKATEDLYSSSLTLKSLPASDKNGAAIQAEMLELLARPVGAALVKEVKALR